MLSSPRPSLFALWTRLEPAAVRPVALAFAQDLSRGEIILEHLAVAVPRHLRTSAPGKPVGVTGSNSVSLCARREDRSTNLR